MSTTSESESLSWIERMRAISLPLIAGVVAGLLWANLAPASYEHLLHLAPSSSHPEIDFHFLVNDVFMALFFGIATKEITESFLPGGALQTPKRAVNPLLATLGGVVGPALVYLAMCSLLDAPAIRKGWGVPTATDIALAWLVARGIFGERHAAVRFLLLLAVADDGVGLVIIALFYPDPAHPVVLGWLLLVAAGVVVALWLGRRRVRSIWPYVLGAGGLSWLGLHQAHLHPALALVPIIPFMPNHGTDVGLFDEPEGLDDTLNRFGDTMKAPVELGLALFGLANAGVRLTAVGDATWAVLVALLVGKTAGISLASLGASQLGFDLPEGMTKRTLFVAAITGSLGLTVALFVSQVAFVDPHLMGAAKMGALLSIVGAPIALVVARMLGVRRDPARFANLTSAESAMARPAPDPSQS